MKFTSVTFTHKDGTTKTITCEGNYDTYKTHAAKGKPTLADEMICLDAHALITRPQVGQYAQEQG